MDFDPESARNQQMEPRDAGTNFPTLVFHHPHLYNLRVPLPGIFVPIPGYTMFPTAAFEQPVSSGPRASFPNGNRGGWSGDESLQAASGQIQDQQLTANFELEFDSTSPVDAPEHQDWHYETAIRDTMPNMLDFPQAGTVAHAPVLTSPLYPPTEQQDWHNEPAAHDNMQSKFDFPSQGSTDHNPFPNGYDQDTVNNMVDVDNANEAIDFLASPSGASDNTGMHNSINAAPQSSTSTYGTSSPLQQLSPYPTLSPEASFSTGFSPAPSPGSTSSPTRHACPHCRQTCARRGDLTRHVRTHFPGPNRKFHCWQPGCNRNGQNAFRRRDKLKEHLRNVHRLEEGVVRSLVQ